MFSRVGKVKEKESLWELVFDLYIFFILVVFPSIFFEILIFKLLVFSHLSYHIYPIYRIFVLWENWFVVCFNHQELYSSICLWLCALPSNVEEVVHCIVVIPLSVEVIEFVGIPLVRGWSCVGFVPSLYWEVVLVERGVVYSQVVFAQILSGGFLCEKSCVDDIVKILLCEGGDVEQWLEPWNISWCLCWSTISKLSLLYYALHYFILFISYLYACYYLCASLLFNQESFI